MTYLGLGYASHAWQAWALFGFYGAFDGLSEPAEKALVNDIASVGTRGTAFEYYNFIVGMASCQRGCSWDGSGGCRVHEWR